jgi:hypothetical protein
MRKVWTKELEQRLRELYPELTTHKVAEILGLSRSSVASRAKLLGIRKKAGYKWTVKDSAEDRIDIVEFKRMYPNTSNNDMAKTFKIGYGTVKNIANKYGLRKAAGFSNSGRFKKGQKSWNKGTKGVCIGGVQTQFKKGHKPKNTLHDGAIRVRTDRLKNGTERKYQWIRISEGKWHMLHVHRWEKANGAVPRGHIVVFRDGDTMNCELSNLRLKTRQQHAEDTRNSDGYIAMRMASASGGKGRYDKELYAALLDEPELLEVKRQQLKLNRLITKQES